MSSLPPVTFASLLRSYRQAAGLTQEELAERAHLSREAIGTLERGNRLSPRKETINLLAEALSLTEPERAALEAAARQQRAANPIASTPPTPAAQQLETDSLAEYGPLLASRLRSLLQAAPPEWFHRIRRHGKMIAIATLVILLLGGTGLVARSHAVSGGTICLATDITTGGDSDYNKALEHAVDLAVMQNQNLGHGYTLKVTNYNDFSPQAGEADPQIGAQKVQQIAHNSCMVGMVGPSLSAVAAAEMPIAANAGLVMISPSNTIPGLTVRPYAALDGYNFDQLHPSGKPVNYFRISPTDETEGVASADFTFQNLEARSAYIVNDRDPYSEALAAGFTQSFTVLGGRIAGIASVSAGDFSTMPVLAATIAAANPDAVFYGGISPSGAGLLKAQLSKLGYPGLFVGDDNISNVEFVNEAGTAAANGSFTTDPYFDLAFSTSSTTAQFIQDFTAHYPRGEPFTPFTTEAYDAAMVLITAIKHLIKAGQPVTRAAIIEQVQHIHYAGVTGPISFDENGDIVVRHFTVYTFRAGHWLFFKQVSA
jgi:branched-chain amino acid transport system substrate-binding protein